jgi:hypothetical protein
MEPSKEIADFQNKYGRLLKDHDFSQLDLLIKQPNIFLALGVDQQELRHSNFLAWLLNPKGSHGIGDLFLLRFLRDIAVEENCRNVSLFDLPELNLNKTLVFREWNNIDLVVQIDNVVIAIENKFNSTEHTDQLVRYKRLIDGHFSTEKKVFVYLTAYGEEASEKEFYINYSYTRIIEILEDILTLYKTSLALPTSIYITDYINAVKFLVMENSPIIDLATKIYKNHKELLDVIIEVKPDEKREFDDVLSELVVTKGLVLCSSTKGYVRFLPEDLVRIIPKGKSTGWLQKESFLFEFVTVSRRSIALKAVVAPGDENERALLSTILSQVEGSKTPEGKQWLSFYQLNIPVSYHTLSDEGKEAVLKKLEKEWPKVEQMISKISTALLTRKDDFIAISGTV